MSGHPFDGVVKAWREDPAYRARVEEDPKAALAEKGVDMSGVDEVRIAVDTPETVHVVFPDGSAPLSDDALERAVGGTSVWDPDTGHFLGYTREMTPA